MIVLNVTYKCTPEQRDAFLKKLNEEGLAAACRAEEGNLKYDYYLPADGSDEILLVEKWRDSDALAEHGRQPHIARLKALKTEYVTDTRIERFDLEH